MVEMSVVYTGQKHCELTHGPSGNKIQTDAPKDNQGLGETFHAYRKSVPSQPNVIYAISRVRNGVRQTKSG